MAEALYRYTVEAMERSVRGGCKPDQFLGRPTKERPKTGDGFISTTQGPVIQF